MNDVEKCAEPVHVVQLPRQRGGEIEPEAVHMHLQHPVAQAVHDELQDPGMADVQRVAAAGVVQIVARVVGDQPVVRGVVDPAKRQRRAQVIAFSGMVVHHVENDLDARVVERLDHRLELPDMVRAVRRGRIATCPARKTRSSYSPNNW